MSHAYNYNNDDREAGNHYFIINAFKLHVLS